MRVVCGQAWIWVQSSTKLGRKRIFILILNKINSIALQKYEEHRCGLDLELLTISCKLCVQYPRRSGYRAQSVHLGPLALNELWTRPALEKSLLFVLFVELALKSIFSEDWMSMKPFTDSISKRNQHTWIFAQWNPPTVCNILWRFQGWTVSCLFSFDLFFYFV